MVRPPHPLLRTAVFQEKWQMIDRDERFIFSKLSNLIS